MKFKLWRVYEKKYYIFFGNYYIYESVGHSNENPHGDLAVLGYPRCYLKHLLLYTGG